MEANQTINLIANIFLTLGLVFFMVFVYGRSSVIHDMPFVEKWVIKIALAATACGSLFNILTFANADPSQLLFNIGLAVIFVWAAWFHFKYFVRK